MGVIKLNWAWPETNSPSPRRLLHHRFTVQKHKILKLGLSKPKRKFFGASFFIFVQGLAFLLIFQLHSSGYSLLESEITAQFEEG